jgi:hypothetical protein
MQNDVELENFVLRAKREPAASASRASRMRNRPIVRPNVESCGKER